MKIVKFAPLLCLVLLMACSGYRVNYDYDMHANYSSYKTFDWQAASLAKETGVKVDNPLMDRRVSTAVENELIAHGYTLETRADPDFLVTYYPVYHQKVSHTATYVGLGYLGFRPFGINVGTTLGQNREYKEGTIVLEIVDFKTNKQVWKSVAEGVLTDTSTPEEADEMVNRAVRQMLDRFPPNRH